MPPPNSHRRLAPRSSSRYRPIAAAFASALAALSRMLMDCRDPVETLIGAGCGRPDNGGRRVLWPACRE